MKATSSTLSTIVLPRGQEPRTTHRLPVADRDWIVSIIAGEVLGAKFPAGS